MSTLATTDFDTLLGWPSVVIYLSVKELIFHYVRRTIDFVDITRKFITINYSYMKYKLGLTGRLNINVFFTRIYILDLKSLIWELTSFFANYCLHILNQALGQDIEKCCRLNSYWSTLPYKIIVIMHLYWYIISPCTAFLKAILQYGWNLTISYLAYF